MDIIWLILVFIYIVGASGYVFVYNILAGIGMLISLAIFVILVCQHHKTTGAWQLPLKRTLSVVSTENIKAKSTGEGKSNRNIYDTPPIKKDTK